MTKPTVAVKRLKRGIPYKAVSALQDFLVSNQLTNTLLLVEHPPTYTVGRRIKEFTHEQKLQTLGAEFIFSKRVALNSSIGRSNHFSRARTISWISDSQFKAI
jgi:lipoate-protein ligase B